MAEAFSRRRCTLQVLALLVLFAIVSCLLRGPFDRHVIIPTMAYVVFGFSEWLLYLVALGPAWGPTRCFGGSYLPLVINVRLLNPTSKPWTLAHLLTLGLIGAIGATLMGLAIRLHERWDAARSAKVGGPSGAGRDARPPIEPEGD